MSERENVSQCEMVKSRIDAVLGVASKYHGHVFGSYLLEVLMPRNANPGANIMPWMRGYTTVELWFPCLENYIAFRACVYGCQDVDQKSSLAIFRDAVSLYKAVWPKIESYEFQKAVAEYQPFVLDIDTLYAMMSPKGLFVCGDETERPPKTATFLRSFIYGPDFDPFKLERIFDRYIQQGWQIATPSVKGFVSFRIEKDGCPAVETFQKEITNIRNEYLSKGPVLCFFHQEPSKMRPEWEQLVEHVRKHNPEIRIREITKRGQFQEYSCDLEIFTQSLPNIVLINGAMWDRSMAGTPCNTLPTYTVYYDGRGSPLHWYKFLARTNLTMLNSDPLATTGPFSLEPMEQNIFNQEPSIHVSKPETSTSEPPKQESEPETSTSEPPKQESEPVVETPVESEPVIEIPTLDGLLSELTLQLMVVTMANNFVKLLERIDGDVRTFMVVRTLRKFNELKGVASVAKDPPLQLSTWIKVSQHEAWNVFMNFTFLFENLHSQSSRPELVAEVMTTVSHACAAYL